jgi:hypothetical protein
MALSAISLCTENDTKKKSPYTPPLDIPAMSSFNNNFSREWWYFNVNGHVRDADGDKKGATSIFYMLRVMKRFRTKYPSGTENVPLILHNTEWYGLK